MDDRSDFRIRSVWKRMLTDEPCKDASRQFGVKTMKRRPHLVIFNPDQWRGDMLGHLGFSGAITPNLDRVVREDGVSFAQAVCHNACCTASRCSFFTGWYPHVRGHRTMSHMLQPDEPMLLKTLKAHGYYVWWGGKNDVVPGENGVDTYCDVRHTPTAAEQAKSPALPSNPNWRGAKGGDNYFSFLMGRLVGGNALQGTSTSHDWAMVRGAIDLIRDYDGDRPLCIFLALQSPHPPYAAEEPWFSMIDRKQVAPPAPVPESRMGEPAIYEEMRQVLGMESWTTERWAELRATYLAACAQVDHQFGLIMESLQQAGIYDDTAVFFFADHGDFAGDFGVVQKADNVFPEGMVRVPLVVKPPSWISVRPRVTEALVELIDVPATIEALTGMTPKHTHFGRSLVPLLTGETEAHRDAVFAEGGRLYGEESCKGLELVDEPFDDNIYWPTLRLYRTERPSIGKAAMVRTHTHKYVRRFYEKDELYDLVKDPYEVNNCIDDPACRDVLLALRERLLTWYMETADVVPLNVNARDTDSYSLRRAQAFNVEHGVGLVSGR